MVIITAFQAEDDSSILLSRSLLIIDEIMKETSFKAGVIGGLCGVFTFLALFATTSKASINESAATNGDYKINRVQYEFINELTIYKVSGPGISGTKYVLRDSEKGGLCVLNP
mgnify:FL=1